MMYTMHYDSPLGGILLAADEEGLTGLWFETQKYFAAKLAPEHEEKMTPALDAACRWLDVYFSGQEPDFTPKLHLVGSDFRQAVWALLRRIPYGQTTTYGALAGQLAEQSGKRVSAQAVGGAVGHNPISLIVPCHRVVGSGGSLLCVVPRDPNATLAVNRIRYNTKSGEYENLEVLYRSETGEPILVYACADMGESPFPDTEITVTDSSGRTAVWRPRYGTSIRPDDYDMDAPMGYDFTNYSQEHGEDYDDDYGGDVDGDVSWMAPTAEQLCRNVWVWDGDLDRQYAIASIFFEPGGWVTFEWWYEEDNGAYQEVYEGDWSLQDDMLGLRMTRTGGERFREGERAVEITGVFPVQIPMGFEDFPILNIAEGVNGELLPIQVPPSTLIYFLPAMG